MTRSEFQASEPMMAQLDEILKFPIVKTALEIVRAEGAETSLPVAVPGVDYGAQVAAIGAKSLGWAAAIRALGPLARKSNALQQHKPVAQREMYMDEAMKRVISTGQYTEAELRELQQ